MDDDPESEKLLENKTEGESLEEAEWERFLPVNNDSS
jgi:hypothetical protein